MSEQIITKRCTVCKQIKPVSEFYKNRTRKDNHRRDCKVCNCKRVKEYRQTERGRESNRQGVARYLKTKKGKACYKRYRQTEKGKAVDKRFRIRHPECRKAKDVVNHAVNAGKLPKIHSLLCVYCSKPAQQYHHWHSYEPEHWLDVIPVCRKCHNKLHRSTGIDYLEFTCHIATS